MIELSKCTDHLALFRHDGSRTVCGSGLNTRCLQALQIVTTNKAIGTIAGVVSGKTQFFRYFVLLH